MVKIELMETKNVNTKKEISINKVSECKLI